MFVKRFFVDALTGEECAIIYNGTEDICVAKKDVYDFLNAKKVWITEVPEFEGTAEALNNLSIFK